MTNRLIYETVSGELSAKATFEQLIEFLSLAEEDARELNRICRLRDDEMTASGWMAFANNFKRVRDIVSHLSNTRTKTGVGYGKPN